MTPEKKEEARKGLARSLGSVQLMTALHKESAASNGEQELVAIRNLLLALAKAEELVWEYSAALLNEKYGP